MVKLPLFKSKSESGNSRPAAISCLIGKKFKENPEFEKQCKDFMQEYDHLGHMELIEQNDINNYSHIHNSHHAVVKPSNHYKTESRFGRFL